MALELKFEIDPLPTLNWLGERLPRWKLVTERTFERWGIEMTTLAEALSPSDKMRKIDRRRNKNKPFALQWVWDTDRPMGNPRLQVGNTDPRTQYIVFDTDPGAIITPRTKDYLLFFDQRGRPFKRDFVVKGATPGQPVHDWTLKEFELDQKVGQLAQDLVRS